MKHSHNLAGKSKAFLVMLLVWQILKLVLIVGGVVGIGVAVDYTKAERFDQVEALEQWEFKNPRIGISDGSIGRRQCLNVLVELGDELLAFNAGKSWNHLV